MSILTTITNRLTNYTTNFQNNKLNHQPNIDEGTTVTENAYGLFDLFLYYLMNLILFMVLFIDLIVEFIKIVYTIIILLLVHSNTSYTITSTKEGMMRYIITTKRRID